MDHLIRLIDKPRQSVTLEIGDKQFRIAKVVTGVRQLYGRLLTDSGEALQKLATIQAEDDPEIIQQIAVEIEAFAEEKQRELDAILELLLTKNGYEFDREWWRANTDETDVKWFIVESINKDAPPDQKKTVETWAARSDGTDSPGSLEGAGLL